jgi:CheY-like chemotaxis protein
MLIVAADDDPDVRSLFVAELTLAGHDVVEAGDGPEALRAIERVNPDAVVLDVMMPELDGWAVLARLRADERFRELPVVLVSARCVGDDVRHGYELGASAVLPKPYNGHQLCSVLSALVPDKHEAVQSV